MALLPWQRDWIFFKPHAQEDNSGELETVEVFKLEHYAAALRREYVESYESRDPPSVRRAQMRKALTERGECSYFSLFFLGVAPEYQLLQSAPLDQSRIGKTQVNSSFKWVDQRVWDVRPALLADLQLDGETFETLWVQHQSDGGIDYDEFVAVLTKLRILRGQLTTGPHPHSISHTTNQSTNQL